MIHVLINTLAEKMNEFLSSYYERAEIIVEAGSIDATPNEDQSDKIITFHREYRARDSNGNLCPL